MWPRFRLDDIRIVLHYTGVLVVGIGVAMAVPMVTALATAEWDVALDYFFGIGVAALAGVLLALARPRPARLKRAHALVISATGWASAALIAAVPLALSGNYLSYLDALFDTVSGLTTSGLTVAVDLDHMSLAHNMWRHLTHLIGGQGIIVAALAFAIGVRGGGAFSLYEAEGRDERVLPNVLATVRFIWFVTAVWVLLGTAVLGLVNIVRGMSVLRGMLHGFWIAVAAFDTGGFGPQSQNILYYHSPWLETFSLALMLAGTLNFNLHADLWRGDYGELRQNLETRALALNMTILSFFAVLGLATESPLGSWLETFRKGVYHIISAHSGTGHQTLYPSQWIADYGPVALVAVIIAMGFGGSVSSTAGGIKALRFGLIVKWIVSRIKSNVSPPSAVIRPRYHHLTNRILTPEAASAAMFVLILYVFTYISGGVIGASYGFPLVESMFESVSAAANVGLSTGITSLTMPTGLKLLYMLQMWAGRLEFIALMALVAVLVLSLRPEKARQ